MLHTIMKSQGTNIHILSKSIQALLNIKYIYNIQKNASYMYKSYLWGLNQLNQAFYILYIIYVRYPSYIYDGAFPIAKNIIIIYKNRRFPSYPRP